MRARVWFPWTCVNCLDGAAIPFDRCPRCRLDMQQMKPERFIDHLPATWQGELGFWATVQILLLKQPKADARYIIATRVADRHGKIAIVHPIDVAPLPPLAALCSPQSL